MGANTANISRDMFDETLRYVATVIQKKIPWVDADANDQQMMLLTHIRRVVQTLLDSASPNDGFKPVGTAAVNDFTIKGGDGTVEGGGRIWAGGFPCLLLSDIAYVNSGTTEGERSIHPRITGISGAGNEVLEDSAASYVVNALVGRTITPDITTPATTVTVVSNTATTITTDTDLTAAGIVAGDRYRIELSTPSSNRTDGVFLNVYLDEIDTTEDPNLIHNLVGSPVTAQLRKQVAQTIFVEEGGETFADYVDADGNQHYVIQIGRFDRLAGDATITAGMVTDLRKTAGDLTAFIRKAAPDLITALHTFQAGALFNTSGALTLNGVNIDMVGAETVDGVDVSALDTQVQAIPQTGPQIAAVLNLLSIGQRSEEETGISGTSANVSKSFTTRTPGGGISTKGVLDTAGTSGKQNVCLMFDSGTGQPILDGLNPVFGKLTSSEVNPLTGTITFTNGSATVSAAGDGDFVNQINVGDIISKSTGDPFGVVASIADANNLTLTSGYAGTSGTVTTAIRRRFTLSFLKFDGAGSEIAATLTAQDFFFVFRQVFDLDDRPHEDRLWDALVGFELAAAGGPTGPATGDLAGSYPGPAVVAIQGRAVQAGVPVVGEVLEWSGSQWEHRARRRQMTLEWQGAVGTLQTGAFLATDGFSNSFVASSSGDRTAMVIPFDGTIRFVQVMLTKEGIGTLSKVQILLNGSPAAGGVFSGLSVSQPGQHAVETSIAVLKGQLAEVVIDNSSATGAIHCIAHLVVESN